MRRRRFLRATTAVATVGVGSLAGCLGIGTPDPLDGDSFPVVDRRPSETEVGPPQALDDVQDRPVE